MAVDPRTLEIPSELLIQQMIRERVPSVRVMRGSAVYESLVVPGSIIFEDLRRVANVIRRNLSVNNAALMLEEEMDDLAANVSTVRNQGTRVTGIQRVFFADARAVSITTAAVFSDASGLKWFPVRAVSRTSLELQQNVDADTGEFFVDVDIIAENVGDEYAAGADQILRVRGVDGASRTANLVDFELAVTPVSNVQLATQMRTSIANRELVKEPGIAALIQQEFPSVRSLDVFGFGHPSMQRDTVQAVVSFAALFQQSFGSKVNVPLDANGNVQHFDDDGNPIAIGTSLGGSTGAVYDLTGLDFLNLTVTQDGVDFRVQPVAPGMRVIISQGIGYPTDPDVGEYIVRRVVTAKPTPTADETTMLLLDRAFGSPDPEQDVEDDLDQYPYRIDGPVFYDRFHVGGKIDIVVDSSVDEERSVIITALEEVTAGTGVYEIPLTTVAPLSTSGESLFEDGQGFVQPVIEVVAVEVLGDTGEAVELTLDRSDDYRVIRKEARARFTEALTDILRIEDPDADTSLLGARVRIRYVTNPDIPRIQDFVTSRINENLTGDLQVNSIKVASLDVEFSYRGTATVEDLTTVIRGYVNSLPSEATLTVYDLTSLLVLYGVTDVVDNEIRLAATVQNDDGTVTQLASTDRITAPSGFKFRPLSELSITQVG